MFQEPELRLYKTSGTNTATDMGESSTFSVTCNCPVILPIQHSSQLQKSLGDHKLYIRFNVTFLFFISYNDSLVNKLFYYFHVFIAPLNV